MTTALVLWDIDLTLINAGGTSPRLYGDVFRGLFGRELTAIAPMAGRTDRAIVTDTLRLAGIAEPGEHVEEFLNSLAAHAPDLRKLVARRGVVLPGARAALAAVGAAADGSHAAGVPAAGVPAAGAGVHAADGAAADGTHAAGTHTGSTHAGSAGPAGPAPAGTVQSVLTGNIRPLAEAKLQALGLTGYLDLDVGAYGDHHEVRAELVHLARIRAARAYGTDFGGEATVLIGDTPLDVAAALATGARVVGVATGAASADDLADAGAHAVLPDLTDTGAVLAAISAAGR